MAQPTNWSLTAVIGRFSLTAVLIHHKCKYWPSITLFLSWGSPPQPGLARSHVPPQAASCCRRRVRPAASGLTASIASGSSSRKPRSSSAGSVLQAPYAPQQAITHICTFVSGTAAQLATAGTVRPSVCNHSAAQHNVQSPPSEVAIKSL